MMGSGASTGSGGEGTIRPAFRLRPSFSSFPAPLPYSDAHGAAGSWKATKPMSGHHVCVEQSAVELFSPPAPAGRLLVNCRGAPAYRSSLTSDDGGVSTR